MERKQNKFAFPSVGGSSLLVIFSVLCQTVFTLLALSTVQASDRLSRASADAVSAYYNADCEAEAILAKLRDGEIPDGVTEQGDVYSYTCAISENQLLAVEVELPPNDYRVLRWQAVSSAEWQPDNTLPVWPGNFDDEEMLP